MFISRSYFFYPIFLSITADILHAQRQSVYVPNYQRAFDYSNIDETPLTLQQQEEEEIRFNEALDLLHAAVSTADELPLQTDPISTEVSTESTKSFEETTSTISSAEKNGKIIAIKLPNNTTQRKTEDHQKKSMIDRSNQKIPTNNYRYDYSNSTLEQAAEYLAHQKLMRSIMHLIPPSLWAQIQNNRSGMHQNQTHFIRPAIPNPVQLAETAAQAGSPYPGSFSVPEHLWYRYPPQIITRPTTKSSTTTTTTTTTTTSSTTSQPRPFRSDNFFPSSQSNRNKHSLFSQIGFVCPPNANGARYPDRRLCNMYFTCTLTGLPEPNLCPEGYLFSEQIHDCELAAHVNCGTRVSAFFELEENKINTPPSPPPPLLLPSTTFRSKTSFRNGSVECILGADGYYEDPLYCNVYHHCIAGIDYAEPCPNQLAWNDKKKMCDWAPNVNCTGKTMPVLQSKTSFCTNRQDGRYASDTYCNVFHDCIGGTDNVIRCTGELQWDDIKKECGWKSSVRCGPPKKMLASDNLLNSTFCTGKPDGSYPHEEYCNVYHVCESGSDNMRQCPHQLFWDNEQQKCEWSDRVHCSKRTLVAISMETNTFCLERSDGYYIDPQYCNVYHQCMADIDVKLQCPERLVFNETLQRCDWPESTICKSGNLLVEDEETNQGYCADKPNGNFAHEQYCNRYYICQNGKDVVFTCQNNLRYSIEKNECDWAVNVDCKGKADYMWEGIKENFCKRLPDGNYPDIRYCNTFHQCQAAMDYPKRCPNRLMFNEETKECDWEDKVDCKGREKLIDTEGLDDAVRPGSNNTQGRSTKFCMVKQNGDYPDLYYCNVYHNCHGGFDTIQYCTRGLVWRQESETTGRCDWPKERSTEGVDCEGKALFFVEKLAETDILANLRSEFCISKGPGLYEHQRYCDLYLQCNEQGVGVTMECSPGLVFNEKKKECDYQGDSTDGSKGALCLQPRSFLRSKPKAEQASILFEGADATGRFPTRFDCLNKNQQTMFSDLDWCNLYHVCVGSRDNIFLCPPGTIFNDTQQGCMDRFDGTNCNATRPYYKPSLNRQKRAETTELFQLTRSASDIEDKNEEFPHPWKRSYRSKRASRFLVH